MLYGDRNFLKASVTKSLVELQTRLINLYVSNLRSLGTQATLMGFFCVEGTPEAAFKKLFIICQYVCYDIFIDDAGIYATHLQDTGAKWPGLHVMYDMFIHLAFTLSLFGASQVTRIQVWYLSCHGTAMSIINTAVLIFWSSAGNYDHNVGPSTRAEGSGC